MIFRRTIIDGVWVIEPERLEDERGFFARVWDTDVFSKAGLNGRLVQCSISHSRTRGTLRGIHYQAAPHEEAKLVRCTAGAIFAVAVDLRASSPTARTWFGLELSVVNRLALYVPEGCGHGYLTLADDCDVLYQMSEFHAPGAARGVRWDDPAVGIEWPAEVIVISDRDRTYPDITGVEAAS